VETVKAANALFDESARVLTAQERDRDPNRGVTPLVHRTAGFLRCVPVLYLTPETGKRCGIPAWQRKDNGQIKASGGTQ